VWYQLCFYFFKKLLFHYINFGYVLQRSLCEGKLFNSLPPGGGGGGRGGGLHLQHRPRELQHFHACKLCAMWRIYTQNAREKQACKITRTLNYTQYACIYRREISSPLLLHISCVYFLTVDFKRNRNMLIDHSLFTFQYELYVLTCLFESGLFKVDNRFCSSQHVLYICS